MRLFLQGSLLAIAATIAGDDNLFDDDSLWDASSSSQDIIGQNQEFLLSNLISEDLTNASPDYSLFSDSSDPTGFNLDDSLDLITSCRIDGDLPLRARDDDDGTANSCPAQNTNSLDFQGGLLDKPGEWLKRLWDGESIFDLMKKAPEPSPQRDPPPGVIKKVDLNGNECGSRYPEPLCCRSVSPVTTLLNVKYYAEATQCTPGMLFASLSLSLSLSLGAVN